MHNLIKTIAAKLNATETEASQVMQEIRAELSDFVAEMKQEADIALTKARVAFEDAAARGFPDHDYGAQDAKFRDARIASNRAAELETVVANIVEPALVAPVEPHPIALTPFPGAPEGPVNISGVESPLVELAIVPVELVEPVPPISGPMLTPEEVAALPEPVIETKTYEAGTIATGTAPLPEQSPVEPIQDAPAVPSGGRRRRLAIVTNL